MLSIKRLTRELTKYRQSTEEAEKRGEERLYYYFPDETNISIGYALLFGPKDTPYEGGAYLIRFTFPETYPFQPPQCEFLPLGGIRHSPNLYENGKVCLSVIGTWGESTYKSIIGFDQIIMSIIGCVFVNNALDCEPNYDYSTAPLGSAKRTNCINYDAIVRYANFKYNTYMMCQQLSPSIPTDIAALIKATVTKRIVRDAEWYINRLCTLYNTQNGNLLSCTVYTTTVNIKTDYLTVTNQMIAFLKSHAIDAATLAKTNGFAPQKAIIVKRAIPVIAPVIAPVVVPVAPAAPVAPVALKKLIIKKKN